MAHAGPDLFVVINGPEDGTEFPVVRAPVQIGSGSTCAVNLRLDETIEPFHALATAVAGGYRVVRTGERRVSVNGKRVGRFFARILRPGDVLRVGGTELAVECAGDGLASRTSGLPNVSGVSWALGQVARDAVRGLSRVLLFGLRLLRSLASNWLFVLAVGFLLFVFWPTFRYYVQLGLWLVYDRVLLEALHRAQMALSG
jgi:type III secretion system (T3SS) inner membrane Yop/YscD-like protein